MSMRADSRALAQEAIELAGKATPGPWRGSMTGHSIKAARDFDEVLFAVPCDGRLPAERWREWLANVDLTCHAGTHYATIAKALIEALDRAELYQRDWYAAKSEFGDAMAKARGEARAITADRDALLADLPHALGRCGCKAAPDHEWGYASWPEAHTAAIARLEAKVPRPEVRSSGREGREADHG